MNAKASLDADSLCNTVSNSFNFDHLSPSSMGGNMEREVRANPWKMAPARS